MNYYNEWDPFAAAWLRNLIAAGLLPDGYVDERSITDVQPEDLKGFTQCHFFAGIGGWPLALELAGWPSDAVVFTGSCPCQPFSIAGKSGGTADSRHLWPQLQRLIAVCNPPVVFGEQVAGLAGRGWLARVRADLEALGYGVGVADLCAPIVGAPHRRSRLWWLAESSMARWPQASTGPALHAGNQPEQGRSALDSGMADSVFHERGRWDAIRSPEPAHAGPANEDEESDGSGRGASRIWPIDGIADGSAGSWVADSNGERRREAWERGTFTTDGPSGPSAIRGMDDADGERRDGESVRILKRRSRQGRAEAPRPSAGSGMDDANEGRRGESKEAIRSGRLSPQLSSAGSGVGNADESRSQGLNGADPAHQWTAWQTGAGFWDDAEFIPCLDGKSRRIELGTSPLVDGFPGRVGQLRAYGNAIVPQVAAEFVKAYMAIKEGGS